MADAKALTRTVVGRAVRESLLSAQPHIWEGRRARRESSQPAKLLSMEIELGGLAVEFKAKRRQGLVTALAIFALAGAVGQELMRPRQFRTWHGRVAGFIPYDFRRPTFERVLSAFWAPGNKRLFTDTAFGVGWAVNLAQLPRLIAEALRSSGPYIGPRISRNR